MILPHELGLKNVSDATERTLLFLFITDNVSSEDDLYSFMLDCEG